MSGRTRWLAAVVTGGAALGAGVALASAPVSSSTGVAPVVVATAPTGATTQVRAVAARAQRLGTEIAIARAELTRLEREAARAAQRAQVAPQATAQLAASPVTATTVPPVHTTTGASTSATTEDHGSD
jgi:hypothetical protein